MASSNDVTNILKEKISSSILLPNGVCFPGKYFLKHSKFNEFLATFVLAIEHSSAAQFPSLSNRDSKLAWRELFQWFYRNFGKKYKQYKSRIYATFLDSTVGLLQKIKNEIDAKGLDAFTAQMEALAKDSEKSQEADFMANKLKGYKLYRKLEEATAREMLYKRKAAIRKLLSMPKRKRRCGLLPDENVLKDIHALEAFLSGLQVTESKYSDQDDGHTCDDDDDEEEGKGDEDDKVDGNLIPHRLQSVRYKGSSYDIVAEKLLGRGSFAVVHKARVENTEEFVALKVQNRRELAENDLTGKYEVDILQRFNHDNIICLYDWCEDDKYFYTVLEYAPAGNLLDHMLDQKPNCCFTERQAAEYTKQIAAALQEIHSKNVIHCDIKLENIMLMSKDDNNIMIKVVDFSLSILSDANERPESGNIYYMAPEMLTMDRHYDHRIDVWALGVLLFEFLTGCPPFYSEVGNENEIRDLILMNIPDYTTVTSEGAVNLIRALLKTTAVERLDLSLVAQNIWITSAIET